MTNLTDSDCEREDTYVLLDGEEFWQASGRRQNRDKSNELDCSGGMDMDMEMEYRGEREERLVEFFFFYLLLYLLFQTDQNKQPGLVTREKDDIIEPARIGGSTRSFLSLFLSPFLPSFLSSSHTLSLCLSVRLSLYPLLSTSLTLYSLLIHQCLNCSPAERLILLVPCSTGQSSDQPRVIV